MSKRNVALQDPKIEVETARWLIRDIETDRLFAIRKNPGDKKLHIHRMTSNLKLRTLADWVVRKRLLTIPGVSQVFTMGGGRKQFQVLVNPDALLEYGVTLYDVRKACEESNENATGGYLDDQGPNEFLVRALGRVQSIGDLKKVIGKIRDGRSVRLEQVATVVEGAQVKRGDRSACGKEKAGTS
mgnify:CR=1 FL=1